MGMRIRKTLNVGPAKIIASKSGLSASVGVKGARIGKMSNGRTRTTVSVPGTGVSYVHEAGGKKKTPSNEMLEAGKSYPWQYRTLGILLIALGVLLLVLGLLSWAWAILGALSAVGGVLLLKNAKLISERGNAAALAAARNVAEARMEDEEEAD